MNNETNILIVADEPACQAWLHHLVKRGYQVTCVSNHGEAIKHLRRTSYQALVMSFAGEGNDGIVLIQDIKLKYPRCQIIITFDQAQMSLIAEALKIGAYDYLIAPLRDPDVAVAAIDRAVEKSRLISENRLLAEKIKLNNEGLENITRKLVRLSTIDEITNLYNNKHFTNALDMEFSRSRRYEHTFSMLFTDIVSFPLYTKNHGSKAGDLLLFSIAQIFKSITRVSDTLARISDNEFAALLPETNREGVSLLAYRIETQIAKLPVPGLESLPDQKIIVCSGTATYPDQGSDVDTLLKQAKNALENTRFRARGDGGS